MEKQNKWIDQILQNRVASHLLFWVVLLFVTSLLGSFNGSFKFSLINNAALLPSQMMAAYLLSYYQIPELLLKKQYLKFFLSFIGSAFVLMIIARLMVIYIAEPFFRTDFEQETFLEILLEPFYLWIVYFPAVYLFPSIMLVIKTFKERFEERHQLEILQKEKATTELNFLKAQIHPHFLFNTLNNLYSLTLDKSDQAPEVVEKLSDMLDYMLYQCSDPTVAIHKEVSLLENYITLETIRYGDLLDLVFNKNIENSEVEIAPLILLSIVENAFKHGASGNLKNPTIHIDLTVTNEHLYFKVFNTKPTTPTAVLKKGMGSVNVKRQLDLIYPEKHSLIVEDKLDSYSLVLEIDLQTKTE